MTKPKNANIAPRLMLGFFVQILIFLLFGVYALYDIHKVSDLSRNIYNHPLVVSNAALHANVSIAKMHRSMKDVVLFNSLSKIEKSIEAVNEEEKQVYRQLNIIKKDILGEEGKALERETRKLCDAWRPIRNEVIELVHNDQRENAANITIGKGADHVTLLEANMLRLTQYARNKAFEFNRETESIQSKLGVTLIFFLVLGILTFFLVAFFSLKVTLSAEKELKEAEANLKNTFDLSPSIISKANINTGYFTQVSPVVTNILGFSVEEFTSRPLIEFVHPDDRQRTIDEISGQLQGNEVTYFENRYLCKDGSYKWISWQATPHDKKGIVTAVGSDITERKQAEEALKKAQSLLTETEKIGKVGGWEFNIDTEKVTWTEEVYNIHEIDPTDDLTVTKGVSFYTPDSKPIIERAVRRAINHGEPFDLELEIITAKGNIRTVHAIGKADPKHHRVHGFFQDITTRKMLQEESEKNKTILLEAEKLAGFGGWQWDIESDSWTLSQNWLKIHGCSNIHLATEELIKIAHPEDIPKIQKTFDRVVKEGGIYHIEHRIIHQTTGEIKYIHAYGEARLDDSGKAVEIFGAAQDITEKKKLEAKVLQAQKMESIGTLAGGVAHEINNPINGIMNYAQLIQDKIGEENPLSEYTSEIIHETERVSKIVKNLLVFARQEKESHSPAMMKDIIDDTMSLIQTVLKRNQITLIADISEDLPKIKCRSQQIQQVVMNLLTNARDALNEKYPGFDDNKLIKITSKLFKKDGNRKIRTTIEDHGAGIDPKICETIFDPFFTTKDRAFGTGLGLSISYGIVKDHSGQLSVESEPGQYTKFHMDLPVDNGADLPS